jgi:hypothetical protein
MPRVKDVTDELIRDSSSGPGEYVARVAKAKPARNQTPQIIEALAEWERRSDKTMGRVSKALAYSRSLPTHKPREHSNFIRLIKGGHLRVCEVNAPPPEGSNAKRDSPYGASYYIIHSHCPEELPSGALTGSRKKRRR